MWCWWRDRRGYRIRKGAGDGLGDTGTREGKRSIVREQDQKNAQKPSPSTFSWVCVWRRARTNSCDSRVESGSGGGVLRRYGVSGVAVAALTEAVGAVKRGETGQVGVVVSALGGEG